MAIFINSVHIYPLVWVFFGSEISESNLPKQIVIKRLSIQIVFQNIENSCIREYVKIELKFDGNFSYFDNGLTKNIFGTVNLSLNKISQQNHFLSLY